VIAFVHNRLGDLGGTARQHQVGFGQNSVSPARLRGSDLSAKVTVAATIASLSKSTACVRPCRPGGVRPVFHFRNPAVRIGRAFPLLVGNFLVLTRAIQPGAGPASVGFSIPSALASPCKYCFQSSPLSLAHDALHRGIGFQGRCVDCHGLPRAAVLSVRANPARRQRPRGRPPLASVAG